MAETRVPPRPRQVTFAGIVSATGCGLLVLVLFDQMSRVRSLETREALSKALSRPPWEGSGIGVGQALDVLHGVVLVSGALAAAGCILGVYALRRHRGARLGLTVVAVLMMFSAVFIADVLPVVVAIAAGMLWTRESRAWFDGRVLEPAPPAPPRRSASGGPPVPSDPPHAEMDSWAPPSPETRAGADAWPPPAPHTRSGLSSAAPAPEPTAVGPRPTVVTAALVVTWVSCGLVCVGSLLVMVRGLVDKEALFEQLRTSGAGSQLGSTPDAVLSLLVVTCVLLILWCLGVAGLAVPAARRAGWARVALVVAAALVAVISLVAVAAVPVAGLLMLASSVSVVVLLLLPAANAWYAGGRRPAPPSRPTPGPRSKPPVW